MFASVDGNVLHLAFLRFIVQFVVVLPFFQILLFLVAVLLALSIQKLLLIYGFWGEGGLFSSFTFSRRSKNRW